MGTNTVIQDLFAANPLGETKKPVKPQQTVGASASIAAPMPVDLSYPPESMKVVEWEFIRWKIVVEGKVEAGMNINSAFQATAEGKAKPLKESYSAQVGAAMQLQLNKPGEVRKHLLDRLDVQAKVKVNQYTPELIKLFVTDRKKFFAQLLRHLDSVIGGAFKIDCNFMKFIGVGITWDPDFCFGSILFPISIPVTGTNDPFSPTARGVRINANVVVKFGPSRKLWTILLEQVGAKSALRALLNLMTSVGEEMTGEAAREAAKAAAKEAAKTALAEGSEVTTLGRLQTIGLRVAPFLEWLGIWTYAVSIAWEMKKFSQYVCQAAREKGILDGNLLSYADTYIRAIYRIEVMDDFRADTIRVKNAAIEKAMQDCDRFGVENLRSYLEQKLNVSRPVISGGVTDRGTAKAMAEKLWLQLRNQYMGKPV